MPRRKSAGWAKAYRFVQDLRIHRRREDDVDPRMTEAGEIEDRLFRIVDGARDIRDGSGELASYVRDWPSLYHLSPRRSNLLRPLAHSLGGKVLEVGAGCGALTRFLGENGAQVVALEPNARRASVAAARCRDLPGVSVVCDRLDRFPAGKEFDAILLVGVFEDIQGLSDAPDPVQKTLEEARDRLRPDGCLVLAIENQLGLKYFAGYPEYHTGKPMFGINDLHEGRSALTFGRLETVRRLQAAGFGAIDLFVPLPDYKVPVTVIAPSGLSDDRWSSVVSSLAASSVVADPHAPRHHLFSLGQAWKVVVRNGLLPDLANSFLFVARRGVEGAQEAGPSPLAFHFSSERREPYRTVTEIVGDGRAAVVRRRPLRPDAPGPADPSLVKQRYVDEDVVPGTLVSEDVARVTSRPGWTLSETVPPLKVWTNAIAAAVGRTELAVDTVVPGQMLDATPSNLIRRDDGTVHFFDLEWEVPGGLEFGWLLFRGLFHTFSGLPVAAESGVLPSRKLVEIVRQVGAALGFRWTDQEVGRFCVREAAFQATIVDGQASLIEKAICQKEIRTEPYLSHVLEIEERVREQLEADLSSVASAFRTAEARIEELSAEIRSLSGSLRELAEENARKAERINEQGAALLEARSEVEGLRGERHRLERSLSVLGEDLRLAETELARLAEREAALRAELSSELAESRDELLVARKDGEENRHRLSQLSSSLERTKRALEWHEREIRSLRPEKEQAEKALQQRERDVDALRRNASLREEALDNRAREISRMAVQLRGAMDCLEAMRQSHSWRATEPIRRGTRMLRKVGSRVRSASALVRLRLLALRARRLSSAPSEEERAIEASGLFDEAFYVERHAEKTMWGLTPLRHFVWIGGRQGLDPHPLFDIRWYRNVSSLRGDVRTNPLLHYLKTPQNERQSPCPLFDAPYYLESNPDVAQAGLEPIRHYLAVGARTGRNPHPLFDTSFYLEWNPDVAASGVNPLVHFVLHGAVEGRVPHPLFDPSFYQATNPDIAASGVNPLVHFVTCGGREGRSPHPLFDASFYLERNPEVRVSGVNPLVHYLEVGWKEGRDPAPGFHTADYLALHAELQGSGLNPLVHYSRSAQPLELPEAPAEEHDLVPPPADAVGPAPPSPWKPPPPESPERDNDARLLFDGAYYLEKNPDLQAAGVDPFKHYMANGWRERRDPHPLFSTGHYLDSNRDVETSGENPLLHFFRRGGAAGRSPHPFFDASFYLETYADVRASGINPLLQYLEAGAKEGRQPNPWFDGDAYRRIHVDVGTQNPLIHYALSGRAADYHTHAGLRNPEAWHHDYATFKRLVEKSRQARIEGFHPSPPEIFTLGDGGIAEACASLEFDLADAPVVSIVIPVYNQVRLTVECLCSIQAAADGIPLEIIVADDGSTDATRELLSGVRGLSFVRNETTLGFLRNCNRAAKGARGTFILFLNNDAQVTPGWLKQLLSVFEERDDVGAVGPTVLYPNGRLQEAGARILPDGSTKFIGLFEDPAQPRFFGVRRVDYCSGVCLLLRRDVFERLGGFDEAFAPAYYEDVDLCLRLREAGLHVYCTSEAVVIHHLSGSSRILSDEYKMRCVTRNRQKLISRHWEKIQELNEVKLVAFYLPQYHPIPENDRWWGKGFTDWRNVSRGKPNFEGHDQPRIPADLGFYDLRAEETIRHQWDLARRYGIGAFCYYYYWFAGKRLLEEPLERLLRTEAKKMPFCVAWANENWTRTWDGGADRILIGQEHSEEDDRAAIRDLIRYFRDPDYLRIAGRPVLLLYRHDLLPDIRSTIKIWREECAQAGVGNPYVVACEACDLAWTMDDPRRYGFDASVEFPPHGVGTETNPPGRILNPRFSGTVFDYQAAALKYATRALPSHTRFSCVFPGWDNTARQPDSGHIFAFSSPGTYRAWLETAAEGTRDQYHGDERMVFVNAWNEWAEGCYLEPDLAMGHGYLEATRAALDFRMSTSR